MIRILLTAVSLWMAAGLSAQTAAVNAAAFEVQRPVAPGAIVALFGDFPVTEAAVAQSVPLPAELAGVRVLADGRPCGLYAVFPTQINLRLPLETEADADRRPVELSVESGTTTVAQTALAVRDVSPAVFTLDAADALRPAAVLNEDNTVNSASNPARPGEILQIFAMGQGRNLAETSDRLTSTSFSPLVWFRTWKSRAAASVLPPRLPGMWQINAPVPEETDLPPGPSPLVVTADGVQSNTVTVWLEP